ncbi:MAG: aminotransferase class I/II-fold pyridoxal phosphate-dependent enzyme [Myxococcota bacterium]
MSKTGFNTQAVHAGERQDESGALDTPVVQSSAFAFASAADARARFEDPSDSLIYGRWRNPTVEAFERAMAALEGAEEAVATSSGMAAIEGAIATFVAPGDEVLAPLGLYAETAKLLRERLARFGVTTRYVDMTDLSEVDAAWTDATRLVWCETPANPVLAIYDIAALSERARKRKALLAVDATFATPFHQVTLAEGADLVVHSATKAIGGHGDVIGGVVCGASSLVHDVRRETIRGAGAMMAPMSAWLLARGLRTLGLRMAQMSASAATLAARLEADPRVAWVSYPGLDSHPQHALAVRQMRRGFGAVVAFEVEGGLDAGARAYDNLALITRAVSLGDVRTLATHPASTTHSSMPPEQRHAAGIRDGLFRLAVGIEDVEDLWADLDQALDYSSKS